MTAAIAESPTDSWNLATKNGNLFTVEVTLMYSELCIEEKKEQLFSGWGEGGHSWGDAYAADHPRVTSPMPSQKQFERVEDGEASKNKNYKTCYFPPTTVIRSQAVSKQLASADMLIWSTGKVHVKNKSVSIPMN